jgi:Zn-dependent protease
MITNSFLLAALVTLPILLASLVLHELAHGAVAAALGDPTARLMGRLTLNPLPHLDPIGTSLLVITLLASAQGGGMMFGWAKPIPVDSRALRHPKRDMALISAAGPLTNVAIAVVAAQLLRLTQANGGLADQVIWHVFVLNVVLAVLNLIPIPPLDGSRVLGALLPGPLYRQWAALDRFGMLGFGVVVLFLYAGGNTFSTLVVHVARFLAPGSVA